MLPINSTLVPTVSRFLNDDWNHLFDWSDRPLAHLSSSLPPVNFKDTDESIIIHMAAPGMDKSDFDIQLKEHQITISAESANTPSDDDTYLKREYNYHSFSRSFAIEESLIDRDKIEAKYHDGILTITLPKKEKSSLKSHKNIEVK